VIALARIVLRLLADLTGLVVLSLNCRRFVAAGDLFLRRELALYQERSIEPKRTDAAARVSLVLRTRLFDWRDAMVVVRSETPIRWHRAGDRAGRAPPIRHRIGERLVVRGRSVLDDLRHECLLAPAST
jgi:hypothetical protein